MMFCMSMLTVVIYWIGARMMNETDLMGRAEVMGNMTAFTQLSMQVVMSFMMLVMIFVIMPRTQVAAKRINEVLKTEPMIKGGSLKASQDNRGTVEFKNVTFSYSNDL